MKKYRRVELDSTPGSPCLGCELELEDKTIGNYKPNTKIINSLICTCENCKKRQAYYAYTIMTEFQIPNAGSSFNATILVSGADLANLNVVER